MKKVYILVTLLFFCLSNAQLKIGDAMPYVTLQNNTNKEISISSFKGKPVLIDFWASWCGPCRKANKKMVSLHAKSNERLEIIGVSVDKDASKWLKAIEKDKINYTQLIDANGFDAETALLFGVEELPTTYLFNKDGFLVFINPTEEQILTLIHQK